jgi:Family of unknown function (DUF5681)
VQHEGERLGEGDQARLATAQKFHATRPGGVIGLRRRHNLNFMTRECNVMTDQTTEKSGQKQTIKGFQKGRSGNPAGKPKGTKSKSTQLIERIFKSDTKHLDEIIETTIKLAKAGEGWAVVALLDRVWPKPKPRHLVKFVMPMLESMDDATKAINGLLQAVSAGHLSISEANELSAIIERQASAIHSREVERRLEALEVAAQPKQIEYRRVS